jgi:cold shock CspA family protein
VSSFAEDARAQERHRGRVARLFAVGYGFIAPEEKERDPGGRGIFFHALALRAGKSGFERLCTGAVVEFALQPDERGPRAVDVEVVAGGDGEGPVRVRGGRAEKAEKERAEKREQKLRKGGKR